jgi:hypothetical protein
VPNLFQTNSTIAGAPFILTPYLSAAPGSPIQFENTVSHFELPVIHTPSGQPVFATSRSSDVPSGTQVDVQRFENDLAAVTPGHQIRSLTIYATDTNFRNGYVAGYTAGFDRDFGDIKWNAAYVATIGVQLAATSFPNGYGGADRAFAPFTNFDASGHVVGGFGPEYLITNRSHSSFHSLETGIQKISTRAGLGFQASYTLSKSLDDTSAVFGSPFGSAGILQQTSRPSRKIHRMSARKRRRRPLMFAMWSR